MKKALVARLVPRKPAEAPPLAQVDFDPTEPGPLQATRDEKAREPAPVVDWRSSSYDLLSGIEIRDHSDTIPSELFERLFKR